MSVILRPELLPADVAQLTLLGAVAVCEAIRNFCNVEAKIKWPNDILVNDKKIAGILTELCAEMDRVRFVVIGIGVNVNSSLSQLPAHATSVKNETGQKSSRVRLLQGILQSLERWYLCLGEKGFQSIIARWKELSSTLGQHVRITDQSGAVEGKAIDLDVFGGLIIRSKDGVTVKRMTGDVIQVG